MVELIVDIHNRCRSSKIRCKCNGNGVGHISVKTGIVKSTDFRYYTHTANGNNKISNVFWQKFELDRTRGVRYAFKDVQSVTKFYHSKLDGKNNFIRKPLIIRIGKPYGKIYWYENLGHYGNGKWERIYDTDEYPTGEDYSKKNEKLEGKLTEVTCRLFAYHGIRLDFTQNARTTHCPICNKQNDVTCLKENLSSISGYSKYSHCSENFSDKYVIVHKNCPITFRKKSLSDNKGYYLPIRLDENVGSVSVYYWDGDEEYKNPLLLEIGFKNGANPFWFENISKGDKGGEIKHDKWRYINPKKPGGDISHSAHLKKRLNLLNCVYNGVVQISVGKSYCHSKHYLHKDRTGYWYGEIRDTYPLLYAHIYESNNEFKDKLFNISEISIDRQKEKFEQNILPFTDVKRFVVYVSPCYSDKPFLICFEYDRNKNHKWYYRQYERDTWKEHRFSDQSFGNIKTEIGDLFKQFKTSFRLNDCHVSTSSKGIKLNLEKIPSDERLLRYYDSSDNNTPIFVTKYEETPVVNFLKNFHSTTKNPFIVNEYLQDGYKIGTGMKPLEGVEGFSVYLWDGEPEKPILLEVKQITKEKKYYGRGKNFWGPSQVEGLDELQALDHQNCQHNNAIPMELTNPTDLTRFLPKNKSTCLSTKSIQTSSSVTLPQGASGTYTGKGYQIPGNAKISRVTYNGQPTNIVPPYTQYGPIFNIYYWKEDQNVPLLVEFKPKTGGNSTWYENVGGNGTEYKEWKNINDVMSKGFYDTKNNLTDDFIKKLHEVNCKVNKVVKLDISRPPGRYCHDVNFSHERRIKVTAGSRNDPYNGFTGYVHEPADTGQTFILIAITNNGKEQNVDGLPLKDISKVTVYFPNCYGGASVAIYIKDTVGTEKWFSKTPDDKWKEATQKFQDKGNTEVRDLLSNIRNSIHACDPSKNLLPSFPHPSLGLISTVDDDKNDKRGSLEDMFTDDPDVDNKGNDGFVELNDEYEDRSIVEYVSYSTFVKDTAEQLQRAGVTPQNIPIPQVAKIASGVTIDISQDVDSTPGYKLYGYTGERVDLEKSEYPPGFYMFAHKPHEEDSFTVNEVQYGGIIREEIKQFGLINSYSVWYWTGDEKLNNPLLVEVLKEDGTYIYKSSKGGGNSWYNTSRNNSDLTIPLEGEELEEKLDDLNCQLNNAATINLSKNFVKNRSHSCANVCVDLRSIRSNDNSIDYYKYTISDQNYKLAKIKYYIAGNPNRKRITATELEFPLDAPVDLYTFYCSEKPVLIYVSHRGTSSQPNISGWYKKGVLDSTLWTKVTDDLPSISPNTFDNIECINFNKIANALGCVKNCSDGPRNGGHANGSLHINPVSLQSNLEVTIKLSQKPARPVITIVYIDPPLTGKAIEVILTNEPDGSDFLKYEHTDSTRKPFKLKAVEDDQNRTVSGANGKNVTSVSAYYWKDEDSTGNYKYYENSKNNEWKDITGDYLPKGSKLSEYQLLQKLTFLNCDINDVVQIYLGVTRTITYCHHPIPTYPQYGHAKKIRATPAVDSDKLINYVAYEHAPMEGGTFNISKFTNGTKHPIVPNDIKLPIKDVKKVIVYLCIKGNKTPLLIYLDSDIPKNPSDRWFQSKNGGKTWDKSTGLGHPNDNKSIINILDGLESACKPPTVTIDIYKRGEPTGRFITYRDDILHHIASDVYVNGSPSVVAKGFTECEHNTQGRDYFKLQNVNYNGKPTTGILSGSTTHRIIYISVFYWSALEDPSRKDTSGPLLVKVTTQEITGGFTETYYENTGDSGNLNWGPTSVDTANIETKLDLLNCKLNNAVVININERPDNGQSKTYDACERNILDGSHGERMQVKKDDITSSNKLGNYEVYKHTLNNGGGKPFHIVGFRNDDTPLSRLPKNILDVDQVKVYFCSKDDPKRPLLIYYKTNGAAHHWYKNTYKDGTIPGNWIPAELSNTNAPEKYDEIKKVLNSLESKCSVAQEGEIGRLGLETATVLTGGGLYGVISGVFGGSGAAGLAGWKLYKKFKGDPWVRQI
ncbi:hypothetical protein BEWA_038500 [Theileria equi strain WA]|uniref:Uncharacterized protein n=1 Tax=Theileria equi strain WA TaxID=1537102 RepID=L1LF90_THEEQ|nr:hypothetical protein BEWA_038500 [Theileria equi strain WA]EKX73813.1 hypothetical protein BEWA_038500 [Theileria equi strain WA]|eukprot:XP_004833265.1 hypothetical protein BEWA_038500 [Theileria equi strain WA]